MKPEVLLIAGARPNFMKIAPIVARGHASGRLRWTIVHTGQHYDREMSQLFFEELGIPDPEVRLDVGSGTHARQTAEIMIRFETVVLERSPEAVVVVGDVNSTVAASLVAVKLGIPVAHVEAGLRSFDRSMPEEINRIVTDALSRWLFVSERSGLENLSREGADPSGVHLTGNVMIDTLLRFRERARSLDVLRDLVLRPRGYAVLTLHRPANVDDPDRLASMLGPIRELSREMPVLFPVHPRTRATVDRIALEPGEDLRVTEPVGYLRFLGLLESAGLVLTDSGGIQEETTVLGVPCVTLRENTERPVTLTEGTNRLGGVTPDGIRAAIAAARSMPPNPRAPELWDGKAAGRIVDILEREIAG